MDNQERKKIVLEQIESGAIGKKAVKQAGQAIGAAVGFIVGGLLIATGVAAPVGWAIIGFMLSATAVGAAIGGLFQENKPPEFGGFDYQADSPTYSFGPLTHTTTNQLPVAIIYGRMKVAGNLVWQSEPADTVQRIQCICNGEIESITDVRVNDVTITDITGCSYSAYMGTAAQSIDSRATGKINGLKRVAYLAYTLKSGEKLRGGNPVVTSIVEGLKVKTWIASAWTGSTYSRNPAACIRDFLTNEIYGVGLPESWLDDASFGEVSEYCDEVVDNGLAGTEARFQLDFVIDTSRPALDILNDMLSTFMGFLSVSGEKIKLGVEKSDAVVVQALTMDNIINGSFGYSQAGKDDVPNKVMIQYIDPSYEWQKIYALAENKIDQDSRAELLIGRSVIERKIALFGITRFTQASRIARRFLRMAVYSSTYCTVSVGIDSIACEVGDVVTVTHDVPAWTAKPFRILAIEETEKDVLRLLMREYNEQIYDDEFGSIKPIMDYGSPQNPYKILQNVDNLIIVEGTGYVDWDGKYISRINCSWDNIATGSEFLSYYVIQLSKASGAYVDIGTTRGTSYAIDVSEIQQYYTVKVKTVSTENLESDGSTSNSILLLGKTAYPSSIEYFSVAQLEEQLVFQWYPIADRDFGYYEIRSGTSWDSGKLIDTIFVGTQYKLSYFPFGLQTYWIKAYDKSGNASEVAKSASILITKRPRLNLVAYFTEYIWADTPDATWLSENISAEWENIYDKTYNRRVYDGKTYHRWDTFTLSWDEASQTVYGWDNPKGIYAPDVSTDLVPYEDLDWQIPTIDLGAVLKVMFIYYEKMFHTQGIFAFVEQRYSNDGITWTDWTLYQAGFITTRYIQLRGKIRGYRPYAIWGYGRYYDALSTVDMIDIRYSMKDIAISNSGTNIEFDEAFTIIPTLVATAMDNDGNDLIPVIDKSMISNTHAYSVFVKGLDGVAVNGFMNLHLEGY